MLENREISEVSDSNKSELLEKVCGHNPNENASEKSDIVVVPEKEPNKIGIPKPTAEVLEERTMTKGKF